MEKISVRVIYKILHYRKGKDGVITTIEDRRTIKQFLRLLQMVTRKTRRIVKIDDSYFCLVSRE